MDDVTDERNAPQRSRNLPIQDLCDWLDDVRPQLAC